MILLGIDQAMLATGWCFNRDDRVFAGTIRPAGKIEGNRLCRLANGLHAVMKEHGRPDAAAIEAPAYFVGRDTKIILASVYGCRAVILATLNALQIPTFEVVTSTWRKSFFPDGTRPPDHIAKGKTAKWWKQEAIRKCESMGIDVDGHDAAEAVGISFWLRANINNPNRLGKQFAGLVAKGEFHGKRRQSSS